MIYLQKTKKIALEPASFTTGASASLTIDRLGYDYVTIDAQLGRMTAGGAQPTTISLSESDDTNASNFAVIAGSSHTSTVTSVPTTGVTIATWDVSALPRKRYLQANITAGSTEVIGILANLSRARLDPTTTTDKNVRSWVIL